jgi:hypothetical protein
VFFVGVPVYDLTVSLPLALVLAGPFLIWFSQSRCHCASRSPTWVLHPAVAPGHRVHWSVSLAALDCSLSLFRSSPVLVWWI